MDDLASWCGSPSLVNPCVLRIAPGHYSLSAPLRLADWVDVVGSGIGSTQLVRFADSVPGVATIIADTASARSRLENLSIVTSYGTANVGVRVDQAGGTLTMKDVFIRSFDALGSENVGVSLGEGHLELQDVTVQVDGTGIANGIKASAGSTLVSDQRLGICAAGPRNRIASAVAGASALRPASRQNPAIRGEEVRRGASQVTQASYTGRSSASSSSPLKERRPEPPRRLPTHTSNEHFGEVEAPSMAQMNIS